MSQLTTEENWRSVTGFEGQYEVSDLGQVRSCRREVAKNGKYGGKLLKLTPDKDGYLSVGFTRNNKQSRFRVSRLVLTAFIGECPRGHEAAHENGKRIDNRLSNLAWKTSKANHSDKLKHGTTQRGTRNGNSKWNETDIERIRDLSRCWLMQKEIAPWLGIPLSTVSHVLNGRIRVHE